MKTSRIFFMLGGLSLLSGAIAFTNLLNTDANSEQGFVAAAKLEAVVAPQRESDVGKNADIASLRRDLSLLQADVRSLRNMLSKQSAGIDGLATPVSPEDFEANLQAQQQQEAEQDAERMAALETHFHQVVADTDWSMKTNDAIYQAFNDEALSGITINQVDCQNTLCRVEVTFNDSDMRNALEQVFTRKIGKVLPRLKLNYEDLEDGTTQAVLYLAKDGYDFPGE